MATYRIKQGKAVTSLRGVLADGDEVKPEYFKDEKAFENLKKRGFFEVDEPEPEVEVDEPEVEDVGPEPEPEPEPEKAPSAPPKPPKAAK